MNEASGLNPEVFFVSGCNYADSRYRNEQQFLITSGRGSFRAAESFPGMCMPAGLASFPVQDVRWGFAVAKNNSDRPTEWACYFGRIPGRASLPPGFDDSGEEPRIESTLR